MIDERSLDNGLRVIVVEDHLAPVVAVEVWYDVGSRQEQPGLTGLAHLFEHLMFQGSRNVGPTEHFELLQAVGAAVNGTTSFDRTNYFQSLPAHALELALWLEADRMATLPEALTQENLDNQRDVVKNERRQRYDNVPYGTAWEHLFALLYPDGHPYHHMPIGSMADLDSATVEDCRTFFRAYYAPANAVLAVVGDVDPAAAHAAVQRYFAPIPTLAEAAAAPPGTIEPIDTELRSSLHEDVPAEALYLAHRLPPDATPESDAAAVAFEVLTGGGASRLVRRLIREEELAHSVNGGNQGLAGDTDVGALILRVRSGASLDRLQEVLDEELARFADEGPTEEEIERAQARLVRGWLEAVATVLGRADQLCSYTALHGDPRLIDSVLPRIESVTADGVREVASRYLRPNQRAVLEYRLNGAVA